MEIVAKGGSLLLGVGPYPEGILQDEIVSRLQNHRRMDEEEWYGYLQHCYNTPIL